MKKLRVRRNTTETDGRIRLTTLWSIAIILFALLLVVAVGSCGSKGDMACTPPPQITSSPPTEAIVGQLYVYYAKASYLCGMWDICNNIVALQLPPGAGIDEYYDAVLWTPGQDQANKDVAFAIATMPDDCGDSARQSWTVHVTAVPDVIAPYVTSTRPANGSNASSDTVITATFSEPVDPLSVNMSSFLVTGPSGTVSGKIAVNGATATFTPSANLSELSTYTVTIAAAVRDLSGNALVSDYLWSFTTGPDLLPGSSAAWGWNTVGELGDGTTTDRYNPVRVLNLSNIAAIAAGGSHSLALLTDGTVWAWGGNGAGELGDGTTTSRSSPAQVLNLSNVIAVKAAGYDSMALKSDGTVWAWGNNGNGQLGDGTTVGRYSPVQVLNLSNIIAVATGGYHSMALKADGSVWAWGSNGVGQLGDGTTFSRYSPVQVSNLTGVVAISAGGDHSLAVKSDGTVWAWGWNTAGELGDGTATPRYTPVQVLNLSNTIAVAAGELHSLALKVDGTVWAWGWNYYGQLGEGTTFSQFIPVQVLNLSNIISIAAGRYHSLALGSDGTVWSWGYNYNGQIGDGTTISRYSPVQVPSLSTMIAIAAGASHSMALK